MAWFEETEFYVKPLSIVIVLGLDFPNTPNTVPSW